MSKKIKAAPLSESDEDDLDEDGLVEKRIKVMRELSELEDRQHERFVGGILVSSETKSDKYASASLSAAEKKGLKEVEELERELDLKNTFSKETNRRDEDAEMNKYIEEQIRLKREAAKKEHERRVEKQDKSELEDADELGLSNLPKLTATSTDNVDDILLQTLSKHMAATADEKSEAMLSNQMLSGIPEVNLGIDERIRTIESTEEAKLRLASGSSRPKRASSIVPKNYSSNFHQHRSNNARNGRERSKASNSETKVVVEAVVSVGEEPKEVEYRSQTNNRERPPPRGKASDDYYLSKFKKTFRR